MRNIQILGTLICCLFLSLYNPSNLYSNGIQGLTKMEVLVDTDQSHYIQVRMQKGMTLYGICKTFNVSMQDALETNSIHLAEEIALNQLLNLPLNTSNFELYDSGSGSIPVVYTTKKQETLYRISKVYFKQDVKDMVERNQLSGFSLDIGQKLIVGYYKLGQESLAYDNAAQKPVQKELANIETNKLEAINSKVPKEQATFIKMVDQQENIKKPVPVTYQETTGEGENLNKRDVTDAVDNNRNTAINEEVIAPIVETGLIDDKITAIEGDDTPNEPAKVKESSVKYDHISRKGVAYWDKNGTDYDNLMVLHKTADINSLIKITNPVNGLHTFARVVGHIPTNAFKQDIDVVMSPAVAKKIGAFDSHFQVKMNYQIIKP